MQSPTAAQEAPPRAATTLLIFAGLVALSFLAARFVETPDAVAPIWKAAGIVLLGVYALTKGARLAAAALFLSAVGDIALELKPPIWLLGMAAFGAAHLFYGAAFAACIRAGGLRKSAWPLAALVVAVSIAMLIWFWPAMGALRVPGLLYQAIITAMVTLALLSPAPALAKAGAVIFMVSDTLIALGLYKEIAVVPGAVWLAYSAAQILLARGLSLKTKKPESRHPEEQK